MNSCLFIFLLLFFFCYISLSGLWKFDAWIFCVNLWFASDFLGSVFSLGFSCSSFWNWICWIYIYVFHLPLPSSYTLSSSPSNTNLYIYTYTDFRTVDQWFANTIVIYTKSNKVNGYDILVRDANNYHKPDRVATNPSHRQLTLLFLASESLLINWIYILHSRSYTSCLY